MTPPFKFDAATALCCGARDYQEDALVIDFARGSDVGLAVLADGMGGHAAGDIASKIVVTEVFSELTFHRGDTARFETTVGDHLRNAALAANECIREHVRAFPETSGMGSTLVASVIIGRHLYWLSIGDSPLFLYRDGLLIQLNEDHSMAPQIDFMAQNGLLDVQEAKHHPDRNVLTSVLFGEAIPQIDCPTEPVELEDGDTLIIASDGLQFLPNDAIKAVLAATSGQRSEAIVDALLDDIHALNDPDLDNVSFSVVQISDAHAAQSPASAFSEEERLRCAG